MPLRPGMVQWPGDRPFRVRRVRDLAKGHPYTLSVLEMSAHTGTHLDAPRHFIRSGKPIDQLRPGATVGPARVIEIRDRESVKPAELRPHRIKRGERILFKTRNSARCWDHDEFVEDFVFISRDAAGLLAERGVLSVGIDYLSVGGYQTDSSETHRILLGAGIWVIEGLNLSRVAPGRYEMVCLPLRLEGGEGAPARAILRRT